MQQRRRIAALLGELERLPEMRDALVGAAEVGEVAAEDHERPELRRVRADRTRERERLLADRRATRRSARPASTRPRAPASACARSARGWLGRHELDRALERGEGGVGPAALVQVAAEAVVEARGAQRVALARPARSLSVRARPRAAPRPFGWRARPPRSRARRGRAPRARRALGTASHSASARSRCASASARPNTASAWRAASTEATSASAVRPAAAQCGASSAGCRGGAARELLREPRVQLLALAGQDRRVDRLRQERVAEAEAARSPDRRRGRRARPRGAATRARRAPEAPRPRRAAGRRRRVRRPRPARSRPCVATVESGHALQQQVAQAAWELAAPIAGRGEELLGEEGVALRAGDDRVASAPPAAEPSAASREQRRQLLVLERPELEHERRARAPDAVGEPAHPLGRRGLVGAVGREQQNRPVVEVVREEDDEIERRGIGPVQILEHEQHRGGSGALGEQRERRPRTPAAASRADASSTCRGSPSGRRASTNGWYGQLRADKIDASARGGPRTQRHGHVPRARTRAASCRFPRLRRGGRSHRSPPASRRARARALRARVRVRRRRRSREPPFRPVSRRHRRLGERS